MVHRPKRLPAFSYTGLHRYSLTFCTRQRVNVFTESALVSVMVDQISEAAHAWQFAVLAYCFMPDHLHLLVEAEAEDAYLIGFAHAVKQRTAYGCRDVSAGALWQKGYFEHVLRDEELTQVVAKYILANPVRSGLCRQPCDYPFSGSLVWSREQLNDLWA
jgi:REP-associated tyrosine transposase